MAEPPSTLAALFTTPPATNLTNLRNFYNIFAEVMTQNAQDTLLGFAKDKGKHGLLVCDSTFVHQPKQRLHCLATLDMHWEDDHPPPPIILAWDGDMTNRKMLANFSFYLK